MKIAVVLSGCGHLDGAEIRESVLSLLYLDQQGAEVSIFAPDINQHHVMNHLNGEEMPESRNVLTEAARIARGKVQDITQLDASAFDGLVMPGGFGVAKNLSDFAFKGADASINTNLSSVLNNFAAEGKPIGAICIAPAIVALALRDKKPTVTIGEGAVTAEAIESAGGVHQVAPTHGCVVDAGNNIISCSAYMRDAAIAEVAAGIEKVITEVVTRATQRTQHAA